jgi:hypothetical protein
MFDSLEGRRVAIVHRLLFLLWGEFWLTALPGAICPSPLLLTALSKWMPVLGYFALLMMLPALLISSYFLPTVGLIRMFTHYEPQTLKGGSLLPLPAYSLADWSLVLPEVGPTGGRRYGTAAASA